MHWINLFFVSRSFQVEMLGSLMYSIFLSANRVSLVGFRICILLVSFSCLIASASASSTTWRRSGDSRNPCLVSAFNRIASSFSPLKTMLAVFFIYSFSCV